MKEKIICVSIVLIATAIGYFVGKVHARYIKQKEIDFATSIIQKNDRIMKIYDRWMEYNQSGRNITECFYENDLHRIAIYGMGMLGQRLCDELKDTDIDVVYGIDNNRHDSYKNMPVYTMSDTLESVDAVIVTAIAAFAEIEEMLIDKFDCPIVSLEEVLDELQ